MQWPMLNSSGCGCAGLARFRRSYHHLLAHGDQADMVARVLIIGGYSNFGSYIARRLAGDQAIRVLIGGRSAAKAKAFAASLDASNAAEGNAIDIDGNLAEALARIAPDIVIHTTGPFQAQDHRVAKACVAQGSHRSEEHTSELQSLMRISYAVFCLKKKKII